MVNFCFKQLNKISGMEQIQSGIRQIILSNSGLDTRPIRMAAIGNWALCLSATNVGSV
ncbi:MAG: hypothetical protein GY801_31845 [bacterium]|nr:hypothetical protein [bacterium]